MRRVGARVVKALGGLLEVAFFCLENILDEGLRISVNQGKPRTLNLHHYAMTFFESVCDTGHGKYNFLNCIWAHCFRLIKSIAETCAKWFATHKHLIAPHLEFGFGVRRQVVGKDRQLV